MAISRTITTNWGITVQDSYCRVEGVLLSTKDSITFHLRFYAEDGHVPFFAEQLFTCPYAPEGCNPVRQAYEYLKTLPEFADAIDC